MKEIISFKRNKKEGDIIIKKLDKLKLENWKPCI